MTVSREHAHDVWVMDDISRRTMQKLFEWSADPELVRRREGYRIALLHIFDGLAEENPLALAFGFTMIHERIKTISSFDGYQDPSRGVEVEPDRPIPPRAFDVVGNDPNQENPT